MGSFILGGERKSVSFFCQDSLLLYRTKQNYPPSPVFLHRIIYRYATSFNFRVVYVSKTSPIYFRF